MDPLGGLGPCLDLVELLHSQKSTGCDCRPGNAFWGVSILQRHPLRASTRDCRVLPGCNLDCALPSLFFRFSDHLCGKLQGTAVAVRYDTV